VRHDLAVVIDTGRVKSTPAKNQNYRIIHQILAKIKIVPRHVWRDREKVSMKKMLYEIS
jgi:hypothetical protein